MKNLILGAAALLAFASCQKQPTTSDSLINRSFNADLVALESLGEMFADIDTTFYNYATITFSESTISFEDSVRELGGMFAELVYDIEYLGDVVVITLEVDDIKVETAWEFNQSGRVITLYNLEDWSAINPLYNPKLEKTLILTEL
tara:strand:- start:22 stop:459 length:438 start_codon:yes stop_codon:yes gene_type:complete